MKVVETTEFKVYNRRPPLLLQRGWGGVGENNWEGMMVWEGRGGVLDDEARPPCAHAEVSVICNEHFHMNV